MRVIAGSAGGIHLQVPKSNLRPTMDLVRGAIFDSLADFVPGARVLDLFAGTGSLGLEALSRGAASVTFVESDRRAIATIRQNLEKTALSGQVEMSDVFRYLEHRTACAAFDLILADPPYAKAPGERDYGLELLASAPLRTALTPAGIFVLEHLPSVPLPLGGVWEALRDKRYGSTATAFLRPLPQVE